MNDPFDSPVPYLRWAWQHYYELAWLRYVARSKSIRVTLIEPHRVKPILERKLKELKK